MNYFYENPYHLLDDIVPLSIYSNKDFNYIAHWHTEFELAYVESGRICIGINNNRQELTQGDIAICQSGNIHYYESLGCHSSVIILVFKPDFFDFTIYWQDTLHLISPFLNINQINLDVSKKIKEILYVILDEKSSKKNYYELFLKAKVTELCATISRYFPSNSFDSKSQRIELSKLKTMKDILLYIENNYTDNISLQSLSKKFNIDPYYLSKNFNSITGNNLIHYINILRISKADSLIMNSKKQLIDIAMDCGFNSIRTFNRVYKDVKGCTPSSIRQLKL